MRLIFHVDMDAFYASAEQRDHPEFRGKPVIVGADPMGGKGRGVVSAASYEARAFGVHSALPISLAFRRCPQGIFLRPRMSRYSEISEQIMEIFHEFSPSVEPLSLDEAFLDMTGTGRLWGSPLETARRMKKAIAEVSGLNASVGAGPNKMVAKIASDFKKPDGLVVVNPEEVISFLDPLPVSVLWGVGPQCEALLKRSGIRLIRDLRSRSEASLVALTGKFGSNLWRYANGLDSSPVVNERSVKSISNEHTFLEDIRDPMAVEDCLKELVAQVGWRLRHASRTGRRAVLKIRFDDFTTITRSAVLPQPSSLDYDMLQVALDLFRKENLGKPVRLVGFGVSQLSDPGCLQTSLFDSTQKRVASATQAMDRIRARFGKASIRGFPRNSDVKYPD